MNCIIVDDDLFSTKIMTTFIGRTPSLTLKKCFNNAIDALSIAEKEDIDIIFLDIEMPEMNGIEFIQSIDSNNTAIIIYSSQEKYALQSYEYNVCDYLLKPVTYARFLKAINKAESELNKHKTVEYSIAETADSQPDPDNKPIYVKDINGHQVRIDAKKILYVEAMDNYVNIVTDSQSIRAHYAINSITGLISDKYLVRIHRSFVAGILHIKEYSNNSLTIEGVDRELPISRSYRNTLRQIMHNNQI